MWFADKFSVYYNLVPFCRPRHGKESHLRYQKKSGIGLRHRSECEVTSVTTAYWECGPIGSLTDPV